MNLDTKQAEILAAWGRGEAVKGINGGDIDIRHAMSDVVSGSKGLEIGDFLLRGNPANTYRSLCTGVRRYARELAAQLLGCSDIETAEAEENE